MNALAWWTFSSKTSCKKDEEKELKPNKTPEILMLLIGQQILTKRMNPKGKLEGA
jgi:hypothetical protein